MDKLQRMEQIGKDDFSNLYKWLDTETGKHVVIKTFQISGSNEGVPIPVIRKISLLREMNYKNVVRMLDTIISKDGNSVQIVLEYPETDLKTFMKNHPKTAKDPKIIKGILQQILRGASYYHSIDAPHGSLSPLNVLIDSSNFTVKLADLGMHVKPSYKAPEVLMGSSEWSTAVDIWSIGCLFAEMVTLKSLFTGSCEFQEMLDIFRLMGTPNEENWPGVTALFGQVRSYDPCDPQNLSERFPGLEQTAFDLLSRMLRLNPKERITVHGALKHPYFKDDQETIG